MKENMHFISGTDTGASKSYATGYLVRELDRKGQYTITQRSIQTENTGHSEDIDLHRRITNVALTDDDREGLTMPEIFSYPCFPHLVSHIDEQPIDFDKIECATEELNHYYDIILLEGVGKLMIPLTEEFPIIDYVAQKGYPLFFITSDKLGSINHTPLSLEAIKNRGIELNTVLHNLYPTVRDRVIQEGTQLFVQRYLKKYFPRTKFRAVPEL